MNAAAKVVNTRHSCFECGNKIVIHGKMARAKVRCWNCRWYPSIEGKCPICVGGILRKWYFKYEAGTCDTCEYHWDACDDLGKVKKSDLPIGSSNPNDAKHGCEIWIETDVVIP